MKTTITILKHEDKTSKGMPPKDYTRFQCQYTDGKVQWMSAFDVSLIEDLKNHENMTISVDIVQKGEFWNLKEFFGAVVVNNHTKPDAELIASSFDLPPTKPLMKKPIAKNGSSETTFYTSYAKDVFIALKQFQIVPLDNIKEYTSDKLMKLAIDLVKQAREAFS